MPESRVTPLALVAATLGAIGCLWGAWCEFPIHPWNDLRLAPAFAIRTGVNPYPLIGDGPLFTWIYGPMGIVVNLPATFAASALGAIQTAAAINALTVLAPLAIIFFSSVELRRRGPWFGPLALAVAVLLVPRSVFVFQVSDHAATACGLLSCWCLARPAQPGRMHLATAAGLCALAVWSKQIAVFLVPAQIAFLLLGGPRLVAVRYIAWTALFGLAGLASFAVWFGFQNLWLNLVAIPGRLPWTEFQARLAQLPWWLLAQTLAPAILLTVAWSKGMWPGRDRESGRFLRIAVLAAAVMLPVGLIALFKIGSGTNSVHSWDYLLPALLLAWFAADAAKRPLGPFGGLALVAFALAIRGNDLRSLPARPMTRHFEVANQIIAAYPHALWFPQHPVITFYADGKLWHSDDGILTRYAAGYGLPGAEFGRHLPPNFQGVVDQTTGEFPFAMPQLAEFNQTVKLPNWTLRTRAPKLATPP